MAEMPIPQDYNRFIGPTEDKQDPDDEKDVFEMLRGDDDESSVEEQPDGSAIVRMESAGPDEDPDFYENLADVLDTWDLSKIAIKYLDLIDKDKEARQDRDRQYEEGIRRTGLGNDAPGGAQFSGASKVVHPVMAEACIDFASRAIKELFPPDGPVKTKIIGEASEDKQERAERKRDYMNWQLTEQIEEFRDEQEQMLTQLPLGGSQYLKLWYEPAKRRPCAEFIPIDNIYLPFAAGNFYTASRVTEVQDIVQEIYDERVASGLYRDSTVFRASLEPEPSKAEKASDRIEGRSLDSENIDGIRRVFHINTWLELEEDSRTKGERAPYVLMIDETQREVVGLYRNWEDGDDTRAKLDWIIEFKFIPWRGAYAVGLPHLIGGLAAALTGSLRALLDSAHINNAATMLKLKGAKISGQSQTVEVTQVAEIEGAPGVDDIRKIAMPMPFNPPSPVLMELLGWLTDAAKGVVTTAEEKIADVTSNAPVGTTQALIEQGAAVFSAVHARLHDSQRRVLRVLARINRWHFDEQYKSEVVEDLNVTKDDFEINSDVVPVSDPHIFAESQRYAQIQTLAARAQQNPDLYNRLEVEKRILKQIKLPDVNSVLPDPKELKDMNPALENISMVLNRPVGAFAGQDHVAHLQTHIQFAMDPMYGAGPIMAPSFVPACIEHIKQHLTLWYMTHIDTYASVALNRPFDGMKVAPVPQEAQQLIAMVAGHVHQDTQQTFASLQPIIQKLFQTAKQMQGQPPIQDPAVQALMQTTIAETQRKAARDKADVQLKAQEIEQRGAIEQSKEATQRAVEAAKITHDTTQLQMDQQQQQHDQQMALFNALTQGAQNGSSRADAQTDGNERPAGGPPPQGGGIGPNPGQAPQQQQAPAPAQGNGG